MISSEDIKDLRTRTGAGMLDCSKALKECNGDMEKAVAYLREKVLQQLQRKQLVLQQKVLLHHTFIWVEKLVF